jgi:hypothetical protein
LSDYLNFFVPSMKLVEKVREGARVHKRYDRPRTPLERVLTSPQVANKTKEALRKRAARLNPAALMRMIRTLQRTFPGYAPRHAAELLDWTIERVLIPVGEWRELLAAMERDHCSDAVEVLDELRGKLVAVARSAQAMASFVCAVENLPRIAAAVGAKVEELTLTAPNLDGGAASQARDALKGVLARRRSMRRR